jgi:hypothetical protein
MEQQYQTIFDKKIMSLPHHALTPEGEKYVSSMTVQQRQLHELAIVSLASSYFVEKTHGFRAYLKGLETKSK